MGTITAGNVGLDFDQLNLALIWVGGVSSMNKAQITTTKGDVVYRFFGDFVLTDNGEVEGGTITRLHQTNLGETVFDIRDISVSVSNVFAWTIEGNNFGAREIVFAGADSILGSGLGDVLRGMGGADSIAGGAGNDTLDGGRGDNIVNGDDGDDYILGGDDGDNYLRGGTGADSIVGGGNFDDINGNQGDDTLRGGEGFDWVVGGQANDLLYGEGGGDIVYGNLGADTCLGGDGNDWVRGGQANDSLDGGAGDDLIWGDRGDDTVTGGAGADTFHFFVDGGLDRVTDFNYVQGDRVVLDGAPNYQVRQEGADTVIDLGGIDRMVLLGVTASTLPAGWISVG